MSVIVIPEDTIKGTPPQNQSGAIPGWTTAAEWNTVILGDVVLPGCCKVKGLKVGIEVETKKAKGSDQATSKDLGLDPAKFHIDVQMNESQWREFQAGLPLWNPRRPGRARAPVSIVHPWPNTFGIKSIRILAVEGDQPTAKAGANITIQVEEWFDAPKPTKNASKKQQVAAQRAIDAEMRQAYINDARADPAVAATYPDDIKNSVLPSQLTFIELYK